MKHEQPSNKITPATPPTAPSPEPDVGPTGRAVVAKGRSVHIALETKRIVGSRPIEINGTTIHRNVEAAEIRIAGPGETVELPEAEIERLRGLGFLVDDQPATRRGTNGKGHSVTGIDNDPRLKTAIR
jgi:hypothetical protein